MTYFNKIRTLCVLAAAVAHSAPLDPTEAGITEAAFELDEQCGSDEDCAAASLQLRQLRGDKLALESDAAGCHDGFVGALRKMAPECIDSCPGSCGALGHAITAYLQKGGQPAAKRAVCHEKGSISCFLKPNNLPHCIGLIKQAAGYGFKLPSSQNQLYSQCGGSLLEETDAVKDEESADDAVVEAEDTEDAVVEAEETWLHGCHDGFVGVIRKMAPECIDSCPGSCGALGDAVTAYLQKGGQPAAKKAVCHEQGAISCFLKPSTLLHCSSLIKQASGYGLKLPSSQQQLDAECNAGIR